MPQRRVGTLLRENGLLLACLGLFGAFFIGMVVSGAAVYNQEQQAHGSHEQVSVVGVPHHRRLRRGDVRELGVRVPADGHVRRADRLPVPEGLLGVEADRRAAPRRTRTRATPRRARGRRGRCARAAGCCSSTSTRWPSPSSCCSSHRSRCTRSAVRKAYNDEQLQHGEAAVSAWRYVTTSQFWFESFQNWQSEFLAVAAHRRRCRSSCGSAAPPSPSRSPNRTSTPVRERSIPYSWPPPSP